MQIVANCILRSGDQVLLLQKPRRGWWVAPGGKVEPGETPYEAVKREFGEETGLILHNPQLRGVFTVNVFGAGQLTETWMLFTYYADQFSGQLLTESTEGKLEWKFADQIVKLPMAEGDQYFFKHILSDASLLTGKFSYTSDYALIDWKPDSLT